MSPHQTLHDLASDWTWQEVAAGFRIGRGRVVWESASYGRGQLVRVARLEPSGRRVRQVNAYYQPDTLATLVQE